MDEIVPLQLQMNKSLRQRLKIAAALNNTTLRDFTVAIIRRGLNEIEDDRTLLLTNLYEPQFESDAEDLVGEQIQTKP